MRVRKPRGFALRRSNPPGCSHDASIVLAYCDMRTLYLRNVPDEVFDRLAKLAAREGVSVSAFALRELREASGRVDNPAVLGELPDLEVRAEDVVSDLEAGRPAR